MVPEIVSRRELLEAEAALELLSLVLRLDVAAEVGRRPRPEAALGAKKPTAEVKRPVRVKLKSRIGSSVSSAAKLV